MTSVVATIFDDRYHYQLAVLVNSLYQNGYRGVVWAGRVGSLPAWAAPVSQVDDYQEVSVGTGCCIRFVSITDGQALTSAKVEFMLQVYERSGLDIGNLFYFDPDVVVDAAWSVFEEWVSLGIALAADPHKSLPLTHPVRLFWRELCEQQGMSRFNINDSYVGDGCLGIPRQGLPLLHLWKKIHEMPTDLALKNRLSEEEIDIQGSLNAAIEAINLPISLMGPYPSMIRPAVPLFYQDARMTKRWSGNRSSRGFVPLASFRQGLAYTDGPIEIFSRALSCLVQALAGKSKQGNQAGHLSACSEQAAKS